ncbi:MAG: dTMP kinase [Candidatus Omnitrophica bacterium]|nr:dTMP kinase [Candidatus Omnitrophota bacterium]MBU4487876.1 dTMP kinase [Candidatus Omnitrophota bacterium]MCG2704659.1 dTMP kinase [Candidatus Omnitrophota bacterium]
MKKGVFITFEGPEGSGKTTQASLLYTYLVSEGYKCVLTREPGGIPLSEKIREILLNPKHKGINAVCETLLFEASRAALVEKIILPSLSKDLIVISDRFSDATLAYQGFAGNQDIKTIKTIDGYATQGIRPDITILLDIGVKVGLKRASGKRKYKGPDRMERKSLAYHEAVRRGYLTLARGDKKRIKVIKTQSTIEKTHQIVKKEVTKYLKG